MKGKMMSLPVFGWSPPGVQFPSLETSPSPCFLMEVKKESEGEGEKHPGGDETGRARVSNASRTCLFLLLLFYYVHHSSSTQNTHLFSVVVQGRRRVVAIKKEEEKKTHLWRETKVGNGKRKKHLRLSMLYKSLNLMYSFYRFLFSPEVERLQVLYGRMGSLFFGGFWFVSFSYTSSKRLSKKRWEEKDTRNPPLPSRAGR